MNVRKNILLHDAKNFEKAGRYEEAAEIYESFGLYDDARKAREKAK
jgi:hypothetical protein